MKHSDIKTDNRMNYLTGIPSKATFHKLFDLIRTQHKKVNYWSGPTKSTSKKRNFKTSPKKFGPKRALTQKDEFLMTLMKLRLGSTNADLAQRFSISSSTVSTIFTTWIKILPVNLNTWCILQKKMSRKHYHRNSRSQATPWCVI